MFSLKVGESEGTPMEPLASIQPRPYCMVKSHILLEVTLFSQNSTDLDWEVEKHPWWRAAAPTSIGMGPKTVVVSWAHS